MLMIMIITDELRVHFQTTVVYILPFLHQASTAYNIAPVNTETTIIPNTPNPALLTCGTTSPAAAPALPLAPAPAVPLLLAPVPLAVELAPPVGVPVAVAVLLLLQKISRGAIPLSMKQLCRSDTDCWTDRQ
jgi:hypothetical protein